MMRADFAAHAAKHPRCPEYAKPGSWREVRSYGLHNWRAAFCTFDQGSNGGETIWYTHAGPYFRGERGVGPEYYTDSYCDETSIGIVARLPHGRFIAGYEWTSNGERVYFSQVFDEGDDASQMASEHARVFAESAREDSERFNAKADAETETGEACREFRVLWPARGVSETLRERVRDALQAIRDARDTLRDATQAYEGA